MTGPRRFAPRTLGGVIIPRLKALFDRLDRNQDGVLEFREFVAIARVFHPAGVAGHPPMASRHSPVGPPARLKAKGHPRHAEGIHSKSKQPQPLLARLKAADKDHDGKLSKDEAPPLLKRLFPKIDSDQDGLLARAEIKKAMPMLKKTLKAHGEKKSDHAKRPADRGAKKHHEKDVKKTKKTDN